VKFATITDKRIPTSSGQDKYQRKGKLGDGGKL